MIFSSYFILHLTLFMDLCVLCYEEFDDDDNVKVTWKGLDTLIDYVKLKYNTKVHECLVENDLLAATVFVHKTL